MVDKMQEGKKSSKKIVFSKEIDSLISGLTLGFSFIVVGLFLLYVPDYFGNQLAGKIVQWIFIVVGGLGLSVEVGKLKPLSKIKGFDDLWIGALFLGGWAALFFLARNFFWNIFGFILLIIGLYGFFQGLFRIIYSIRLNRKNHVQSNGPIISDILLFLTKLVSLALVILQLVKAI